MNTNTLARERAGVGGDSESVIQQLVNRRYTAMQSNEGAWETVMQAEDSDERVKARLQTWVPGGVIA